VKGTLNLLQGIVDFDLDIANLESPGMSEEYGNVDQKVGDNHDYYDDTRVLLNECSPEVRVVDHKTCG